MIDLNLTYNDPTHDDGLLNEVIGEILNDNTLMAMATAQGTESYINTAYFAANEHLDLFFLSSPQKQHSLNVAANPAVAVSIYDSHQDWDKRKKGLQLFGTCELAKGKAFLQGGALYMQRFSGLKKWVQHVDDLLKNIIESKLYVVHVQNLKVFHEDKLGEDIFLPLRPERD